MASLTATDIFHLNLMITTENRIPKKLTPPEELRQMKARFISIREAAERVSAEYPEMTHEEAIEWILGKAYQYQEINPVKHVLAGFTVAFTGRTVSDDEWLNSHGFIRTELERVLNMNLSGSFPARQSTDIEIASNDPVAGDSQSPINSESFSRNKSVTKKTDALEKMTAVLAIVLARQFGTFRRGEEPNVSQIVRTAEKSLREYGGKFSVGDKTLRNMLTKVIKTHAPKIKEGEDSDQNEKLH